MLTIIIPTLQADAHLGATLASLAEGRLAEGRLAEGRHSGLVTEVVVVDGGSTDGTVALAEALGARVVQASRGRGTQLAAGAVGAVGNWLLFLHADTCLAAGWSAVVRRFIQDPAMAGRAGVFDLRFDSAAPQARRLERIVAWRTRRLGLPYGDQGLLLARPLYQALGGFRPLPLMEDVDLVRRLGRGRITVLASHASTSASRYQRDGWIRRPLRNLCCLALWYAGASPQWLQRLYAGRRGG
jgi:rSAM/selenodomain-associated transferase 2